MYRSNFITIIVIISNPKINTLFKVTTCSNKRLRSNHLKIYSERDFTHSSKFKFKRY